MRVFYCNNFTGHNPVGTSAIIIAFSKQRAVVQLEKELKAIGLEQKIEVNQIGEINTLSKSTVIILQDGDY